MNPFWSLPPSMFEVRGAIGKQFVMKRYGKKTVVTKYPDMSRIMPSQKQKVRRRLFARAVRYAQSIYWKPELQAEWRRRLRRPKRLFQALMKQYYKNLRQKEERAEGRIRLWARSVEANKYRLQFKLFAYPVPLFSQHYPGATNAYSQQLLRAEMQAVWQLDPDLHPSRNANVRI